MFPSWSPLKQQKNAMNRRTKLKNQHFSSWEEHTQEGRSQRGWPLNAYSNWRDWSHTQVTRTAPTAKGHTDCQSLQLPSQAQEVLTLWFQRQKHYGFLRLFFSCNLWIFNPFCNNIKCFSRTTQRKYSFLKIQFTYYKIYQCEVYSSGVFSIFTELWNYHHHLIFSPLQKETQYP